MRLLFLNTKCYLLVEPQRPVFGVGDELACLVGADAELARELVSVKLLAGIRRSKVSRMIRLIT